MQQLCSYAVLAERRHRIAEMCMRAMRLEDVRPGSSKEVLRDAINLPTLMWCGKKLTVHLPHFSVEDRPKVKIVISAIFVFTRLEALMSVLDLPDVYQPLPATYQMPTEITQKFDRLTDTNLVFLVRCIYLLTYYEQEILFLYLRQMQETDNLRSVRLNRVFLRQDVSTATNWICWESKWKAPPKYLA